ncbi:SAM-dependent methyltransferase [Rhizobium sp. BK316]|uniref:class I SAM-dependent methyltransferase n=1 Tax=Rhizobium sp. BK316 TaxID=2587053 RepID=UPI001622CC33|nr:class I SAM-dependent methyltransferase [Rhizobium sp. BK316]MBB3411191.1 SAM-dependent methyltransferase [Rhizobium sp. BK316]
MTLIQGRVGCILAADCVWNAETTVGDGSLINSLKRAVQKSISNIGIEVRRLEDPYRLHVYEKLFDKQTLARRPFYNIGAANFKHPYWTSVDYDSDWYGRNRDIVHYDLMAIEPLPIGDGQAHIIYTSHTIEHVTDKAVANLFREAYRVLAPGGVCRVTTGPDAETDYRALMAGDDDWFYWDQWYDKPEAYSSFLRAPATSAPLEERWLHHVASQLAPNQVEDHKKITAAEVRALFAEKGFEGTLDYLASLVSFNPQKPGNHVSWWTHGKVERFLRDAGFTTVYRSGYRQSVSPLMRQSNLFDSTHPQMSIYVEAIK